MAAVLGKGMWGSVAIVLAIALLGVPAAADANTITVDDASDPDGTGCTLEHAIIAANTNMASGNCATGSGSGTDVIELNLPTGEPLVYELDEDMQPVHAPGPGGLRGRYLNPDRALAKADAVAKQAG